ncbi:MAG: ABC transporter permease [Armatimonadota bacterium]|nr:ABC transporter permease [Armatimonadota bacterium]MDR7438381.1 ABC transporter permease [Armatimonadota bacterium]MDR7563353.1 ABC transporter permease [Armatimonadota bacterium]MDR7568576.1 ABC transporter permease [Armatimonadota bacterium]MDR7601225.1 ABC transporter permease [Armatimonadota bacterium]
MAQKTDGVAAPPTRGPQRVEVSYELAMVAALGLIMAVVGALAPRFLQPDNLFQIARNFAFIAAAGVGEALVILSGGGGIDLSVGSVMSLGGVVTTKLLSLGYELLPAIGAGVLTGLVAGSVNGLLVTRARLTPLIPTLGMLSIAGGLALVITRGFPITELGPQADLFVSLGAGFVGPVPAPVIYMVAVVLLGWLVTTRTPYGYNLYAVGGNAEAARLAGIPVARVRCIAYVASGGLAALTGILLAARLSVGDATLGQGMELSVIAAVVIGGVSLQGGRGSILGLFVGAALIGVLQNAMVIVGVPAFWQQVVIGTTIIAAVLVDRLRLRIVSG